MEFQQRAARTAIMARVLVDACLANARVRACIADESLPYFTEEIVRRSPIVRVEYEQAIAIADIGSALSATHTKHWGDGPQILPLQPDDWFYPERVTYIYRENSLYNRRFEQRQRMKELLGREHRPLVERAKYRRHTKAMFLNALTKREAEAIRSRLKTEPEIFWRAARGKVFIELPRRPKQLEFEFDTESLPEY